MDRLWELFIDTDSAAGKLVTSVVILVLSGVLGSLVGRAAGWRFQDRYRRYYARKFSGYVFGVLGLISLGVLWRPFAGQLGLVLGIVTAGVAFAMQEVIGALAGWFNIVGGGIYRVGDRVQVGGVRGDVIDITLLRTRLMEIGPGLEGGDWVGGRQYSGRLVEVSNKATFTEPVFNYSSVFEFIWEEITVPVPYGANWQAAERILREEAEHVSASEGAAVAIEAMLRRYPVARTEVEPRVFAKATDNYLELAARFVVPVRTARTVKDAMTRRVVERLRAEGIEVASVTMDVTMRDTSTQDTSTRDGSGTPSGGSGPPRGELRREE